MTPRNQLVRSHATRWVKLFPADSLPQDSQFIYWLRRYDAGTIDSAFLQTAARQTKLGTMSPDHLCRFFSSVCNRLKLERWEALLGADPEKVLALVCDGFVASTGTDVDTKRALDLLECILDRPASFWNLFVRGVDTPTKARAESLLLRLGVNTTCAQKVTEVNPPDDEQ